jgi:hypothetical protein
MSCMQLIPSRRCSRQRMLLKMIGAIVSMLFASTGVVLAATLDEPELGRTPPRLSLIVGDVSFWRPGTDDWVAAQLNMPLAPGDALYSGNGASAEVQIGTRAFVRLGDDTQLTITNQEPDFLQLTLGSGRAGLDLRELERGHTVQIDTANATVTVEEPGYYRFDVTQDTTSLMTRRGGRARVRINGAGPTEAHANDRLVIEGTDEPRLAVYSAPPLDDWDIWNYDRTDRVLASASSQYLPHDVYGAETLDDYGTWRVEPTYGRVWVPSYVSPGWAPYSVGQWTWDSYYGWTWVDGAPWGWAPFHYGRWVYLRNCWGWAPGPVVFRPVYAPALVAFFGGPGFRVGIGAPFVSWVALGWGEPVVPWWGPPGFVGVPCWRGWGGPRVFNNVFVHNTTIINVHQPTAFVNTHVHNSVVTVPRDRFGGWSVQHVRTTTPTQTALRPLGGELPVKPAVLTGHRTVPEPPRGGATTTRAGFDAPRINAGGRRPDRGATLTERRVEPPQTRTGAEQRRPSAAEMQQAPRVAPRSYQQSPPVNQAVRREPPPPPPGSGGERRADPGHGWSGTAESAAQPRREPVPPPVREAERGRLQGYSAPQQPRPPEMPRVEQPHAPAAPAPLSPPSAPSVHSAPMAPQQSFGAPSQGMRPHAPAAPRAADAPPAPGGQGAPAAAPHSSGGTAPASRGHAVHAR